MTTHINEWFWLNRYICWATSRSVSTCIKEGRASCIRRKRDFFFLSSRCFYSFLYRWCTTVCNSGTARRNHRLLGHICWCSIVTCDRRYSLFSNGYFWRCFSLDLVTFSSSFFWNQLICTDSLSRYSHQDCRSSIKNKIFLFHINFPLYKFYTLIILPHAFSDEKFYEANF